MKVLRLDSAAEAARAGWDDLVEEGDLYYSAAWLAYLEQLYPGTQHLLIAVDSDGGIIAGLTCHTLPGDVRPLNDPLTVLTDGCGIASDAERKIRARLGPALLLGGRNAGTGRILVADHRGATSAGLALLAAAEDLARELGCRSVGINYALDTDNATRMLCAAAGYAEYRSGAYSRQDLRGHADVPQYLASLKGSHRKQVRVDRAGLDGSGWTFGLARLEPVHIGEILDLNMSNLEKYGAKSSRDSLRRLHGLALDVLPDRHVVSLARNPHGQLGGFAIFTLAGRNMYGRQGGFDYHLIGNLPVYFETVFYSPMDYAIRHRLDAIHQAVTGESTKSLRGFTQIPTWGYIRPLAAAHGLHPLFESPLPAGPVAGMTES
ncbi:peptidogalycan biosysnthesis protein [Streptomyces sp. NPDC046985]|uniref:peptidogalycan biosysnthesis protein n=1 Tax=Streptomyces sp. NPDC046985 TaxID=3155377 RepID=UPI0033C3028A